MGKAQTAGRTRTRAAKTDLDTSFRVQAWATATDRSEEKKERKKGHHHERATRKKDEQARKRAGGRDEDGPGSVGGVGGAAERGEQDEKDERERCVVLYDGGKGSLFIGHLEHDHGTRDTTRRYGRHDTTRHDTERGREREKTSKHEATQRERAAHNASERTFPKYTTPPNFLPPPAPSASSPSPSPHPAANNNRHGGPARRTHDHRRP